MDKRMKVGLIGYGIMGKTYANALATFGDAAVAAVAEIDPVKRAEAQNLPDCAVYDRFDDMLRKERLDLAIVSVPDYLHREPVVVAARAGVPVLVEKPFATTLEDAHAMIEAIDAAGVPCMVEFSNRWMNQYVLAREQIHEGRLGRIVSVTADLNDTVFVPTGMLPWASRSSPAWFLMSHTADLAAWVTAKHPVRVFARGVRQVLSARGIDTWDVIEALVEYDDGAVGRFTSGWVLPNGFPIIYEFKMRFVGADGLIDIDMSDQGIHLADANRLLHPHAASGLIRGRYVGSLFNMLRDFLRDLREGREPSVTARDGLENTRFLVTVHQSLETGRPVDIPR